LDARPFLFLVVDAIPLQIAEEAWALGKLPGFVRPRPMVSVFPSLTNVAVGALLRGVFDEVPEGYEALYLDTASGAVRGGFSDPESDTTMSPLHGRPRGLLGHVAVYFLRRPLVYGQIHWITHQFLASRKPWLAYVPATDGVGHFGGRAALVRAFEDICAAVTAARDEHERRTGVTPGIVVCSDHGMSFARMRHLDTRELAQRLHRAGFRPGERGRDGVMLVAYGDVGGGVVYCEPSRAVEVAAVVADTPGVDIAFGRNDEGCTGFARRDELESARILWREDRYSYRPIHGDPLGYLPAWETLRSDGRVNDDWAGDTDLFAATWSETYPDALARVRHGMEDIVRRPAPVLFSMKPTWTYGPPLTHLGAEIIGGQEATHGALGAEESLGFATCSEDDEPEAWRAAPALRPHEVLRPWRELVRAGAAGVVPRADRSTAS
jgi:hypothetical protein